MLHPRYGSVDAIAHKTGCRCHLCFGSVDMTTYGDNTPDSATIDHLVPQSWWRDDSHENLRIAHRSCNASRGTDDPEVARLRLSGRWAPPISTANRTVATGLGAVGGGMVGARLDKQDPVRGAVAGTLLGGLLTFAVLELAF